MGAQRPTIADLAEAAGVSVSTIDRVMNGRDPVRQVTADRVLEAAERIGFRGLNAIRERVAHSRPVGQLGFLLQSHAQKEYRLWGEMLADATRASTLIDGRPVVRFVDDLTVESVVEEAMALSREVDALAMVAVDHPRINHAVDKLAADGMGIFTLVTDLTASGVAGHVGIDDRKKGRTAAWFIEGLARRDGPAALIVGNARYTSQDLAETGFRGYMRDMRASLRILQTDATFEDDDEAFGVTSRLLRNVPDLAGIYVAGGGISGVIAALRAHTEPNSGCVVVVNELTDETRAALIDGFVHVVLSHPAEKMARTAVEMMARRLTGQTDSGRQQHFLPFEIFTSQNI